MEFYRSRSITPTPLTPKIDQNPNFPAKNRHFWRFLAGITPETLRKIEPFKIKDKKSLPKPCENS